MFAQYMTWKKIVINWCSTRIPKHFLCQPRNLQMYCKSLSPNSNPSIKIFVDIVVKNIKKLWELKENVQDCLNGRGQGVLCPPPLLNFDRSINPINSQQSLQSEGGGQIMSTTLLFPPSRLSNLHTALMFFSNDCATNKYI